MKKRLRGRRLLVHFDRLIGRPVAPKFAGDQHPLLYLQEEVSLVLTGIACVHIFQQPSLRDPDLAGKPVGEHTLGVAREEGLQRLVGRSPHSGRRTFITNAARKISTVGGSVRDVQFLAGHSSLATTQRYIEGDSEARIRVVELV